MIKVIKIIKITFTFRNTILDVLNHLCSPLNEQNRWVGDRESHYWALIDQYTGRPTHSKDSRSYFIAPLISPNSLYFISSLAFSLPPSLSLRSVSYLLLFISQGQQVFPPPTTVDHFHWNCFNLLFNKSFSSGPLTSHSLVVSNRLHRCSELFSLLPRLVVTTSSRTQSFVFLILYPLNVLNETDYEYLFFNYRYLDYLLQLFSVKPASQSRFWIQYLPRLSRAYCVYTTVKENVKTCFCLWIYVSIWSVISNNAKLPRICPCLGCPQKTLPSIATLKHQLQYTPQ